MRRALVLAALVCGIALAIGCGARDEARQQIRMLDRGAFESDIQPILERRCANPTCHGREDRPLSVYAPRCWREDPARIHMDEPLTASEIEHDYVASCVMAQIAAPNGSLFARKALGERGGLYHGGGAVFDGPSDPEYRALEAWARGER